MPVRKTTILTADDDPQLLRLMTRTLQLEGYEVLSASDGQEALSLIESKLPDAVLLDVMMPKWMASPSASAYANFHSSPSLS